jgi:DNA helicase-2/ATP-dependent DNA helicase PcrA
MDVREYIHRNAPGGFGALRAAFYYVRQDVTVRPADLLDHDGLRALIEDVPVAPGASG